MTRLPVIVSFGGYNAAGRSSFHQGYQRIVLDHLSSARQEETLTGLAVMMQRVGYKKGGYETPTGEQLTAAQVAANYRADICSNTHIRRISPTYFDIDRAPARHTLAVSQTDQQQISFELSRRQLPDPVPPGWQLTDVDERRIKVTVGGDVELSVDSHYASPVQAAAQLPEGFNPEEIYQSRFHPRGLQLAIIAASDAINAMGLPWETVLQHVSPAQISCYASSVASQMDDNGFGGLLQARLKGGRATSKQLPMGMSSMPADFVNAYVIGNLGTTGSVAGACASFLYNLKAGMEDIQSGRSRVAIVGTAEAPITPEIVEGFSAMSALATTDKLCKIDGTTTTDLHRASRPFGDNCGFVMGEGSQYIVLMDDELALSLGADIHGSVSDVFINADGHKKSISAPGPGNYITLAKAVASARSLLGDDAIRHRSFVQAHGSSTPQNRVTESELLSRIATVFGIEQWPIAAIKAYVGHTLGPASGDQMINTLGVFAQGILPGITTIDRIADDVITQGLSFSCEHRHLDNAMDVAFLNSKGFGGNNASAAVLSPQVTESMLAKRHGQKALSAWRDKREQTRERASAYNDAYLRGDFQVIYRFGENMISESSVEIDDTHISMPGYGESIDLTKENLYKDMV